MAVEEYYFRELKKVLEEIRDEMRGLHEAMQGVLEVPQPIMVNVEPSNSSNFIELQHYFDEWAKKSYGS